MWKTLFESVPGSSHRLLGQPCQDSCLATELHLANETVLLLACSDGAGSAAWSQDGSRLVCGAVIQLIANEIAACDRLPLISESSVRSWLGILRKQLELAAAEREICLRELACTLLVAAVGEQNAVFLQVGDGAIVRLGSASYEYVFWPQSGEYANTTHFVTDVNVQEMACYLWIDERIDEVALFTDGLQMVALDYRKRCPHGPFFTDLFAALRKADAADQLILPMREFLASPQLEERTDDDKTLVLATRIEEHVAAAL